MSNTVKKVALSDNEEMWLREIFKRILQHKQIIGDAELTLLKNEDNIEVYLFTGSQEDSESSSDMPQSIKQLLSEIFRAEKEIRNKEADIKKLDEQNIQVLSETNSTLVRIVKELSKNHPARDEILRMIP